MAKVTAAAAAKDSDAHDLDATGLHGTLPTMGTASLDKLCGTPRGTFTPPGTTKAAADATPQENRAAEHVPDLVRLADWTMVEPRFPQASLGRGPGST